MAEKLTIEQKTAVYDRGGKLLVSAAAGSGKTKVLVDRLISYIMDPINPANVDDFLIITYTKAAATELRSKIASKLSEYIASFPDNKHLQRQLQRLYLAKISTVHAFCADILREYAYRADVSMDFRVIDENEALELQMSLLDKILEVAYETASDNPDFFRFIDSQGFGRDDRLIPQIILKVYNSAKCHLNPHQWLEWCLETVSTNNITDVSQTLWGKYLIDDLHRFLDLYIDSLKKSIDRAQKNVLLEKPSAVLQETLYQLQQLRSCDTWDAIASHNIIEYGTLRFSKKCDDLVLIEQIKSIRNACKKELTKRLRVFTDKSDQVLKDLTDTASATKGLISLTQSFISQYDAVKRARRVLDFSDLEHKTLDLLLGRNRNSTTSISREISTRFREIMVDEYQDSNSVQDAIFSALTENKQNCFMVGDVKQSIYQFRLAEPKIFIDKYQKYVFADKAEPLQGRKVILSKNFRSSAGIISAVNDVFGLCMSPEVGGLAYTDDEKLSEGIPHISIHEPEVELYGLDVVHDTYAEESAFVAERISTLLDGSHMIRKGDELRAITPDDIVILLRSPASVGGDYARALEERGIPCTSSAGEDLLRAEEISVLRSFLQIIHNPLQDIHLLSVLTSRVFGFTANDIVQIRGHRKNTELYHALLVTPTQKVQNFVDLLLRLRNDARLLNLTQLLQRIMIETRFDSIYTAMPDGELREENIQSFCQIASEYVSNGHHDLIMFLSFLDSLEEKGLQHGERSIAGAVTIMSIHKSKGLEFPVVFLCALSRGFNQESVRAQVLCDKELGIGLNCVDSKNRIRYPSISKRAISLKMISDTVSEELRVLYVAMTRARDRLIMTYSVKNLEKNLQEFVQRMDLSQNLLLSSSVDCPGEWIIQAALRRTEAGELFQLAGGSPNSASVREYPWLIKTVKQDQESVGYKNIDEAKPVMNGEILNKLSRSLSYQYPYLTATTTPSKLTATQLKGRIKDQESSENTWNFLDNDLEFRRPKFLDSHKTATGYGTAMHTAMQYLNFDFCRDEISVKREIDRLNKDGLLSDEQLAFINPAKIVRLFSSELGARLISCKNILREFKFSILDDGKNYSTDLTNEKILLQGVVDCAMIEDDGIVVIDFKTDHATEDTVQFVVRKYEQQVKTYVNALQKIYQKPIKASYLYLFSVDRFIQL